jgi:hypothetical protein
MRVARDPSLHDAWGSHLRGVRGPHLYFALGPNLRAVWGQLYVCCVRPSVRAHLADEPPASSWKLNICCLHVDPCYKMYTSFKELFLIHFLSLGVLVWEYSCCLSLNLSPWILYFFHRLSDLKWMQALTFRTSSWKYQTGHTRPQHSAWHSRSKSGFLANFWPWRNKVI